MYWFSRVANFPRDGDAIISENYIAIVGEILLRTVAVALRNLKKIEPVFDTHPPKNYLPKFQTLKIGQASTFEFLHVHPQPSLLKRYT